MKHAPDDHDQVGREGRAQRGEVAAAVVQPARMLETILEAAPLAVVLCDAQGIMQLVNRASETLFGYSRAQLLGHSVDMLVPPLWQAAHAFFRQNFAVSPRSRAMGTGRELFALRADGSLVPVEIALTPIATDQGPLVMSMVLDVADRRRLERRFEAIVESAPIAMVMFDQDQRIVLVNHQAEALFGYPRSEMLGQHWPALVPGVSSGGPAGLTHAADAGLRRSAAARDEWGLRRDGQRVAIQVGLGEVPTEEGLHVLAGITEVTERRRLEGELLLANQELERRVRDRTARLELANREKERLLRELRVQRAELERLSREDPLTHLDNRREFDRRLHEEVQRAQRTGLPLAVAMLDLDLFKSVNDRFGHAFGDRVLRQAAELIRKECRNIDSVARYGGEEFALAFPATDMAAAKHVCERIREALARFDWSAMQPDLRVTLSAGVSAWAPGMEAAALVNLADERLYEAKRSGRNRVVAPLGAGSSRDDVCPV